MSNFLIQIEKEIKRLSRDRDALEKRIKALAEVHAEYLKDESLTPRKPRLENRGQGRVDKIVRILKEEARPLHYLEIVDLLEKKESEKFEGVKDKGATITATLSLHRDLFKRVGKGTYMLIEDIEKTTNKADGPT
jgi:hypothetical protein